MAESLFCLLLLWWRVLCRAKERTGGERRDGALLFHEWLGVDGTPAELQRNLTAIGEPAGVHLWRDVESGGLPQAVDCAHRVF
jgi:hypothetical protein